MFGKKQLWAFVCAAILVLSLNAALAQKTEPVELKIWMSKQEIMEPFQTMCDKFSQVNPNIKITVERPGGDQYFDTIKILLASGDKPDLIMLSVGQVLEDYYEGGLLLDLAAENYNCFESSLDSCRYKGALCALPMDIAGVGVIYNKALFNDAGIEKLPETVAELSDACAKLKAIGVDPFAVAFKDTWTLRLLFSIGHTATVDIYDFVNSMNAGQGSFNNSQMEKTFETFDLIAANCNKKPMDSDYNNQCTLFAQGKAAMMIQGLWALSSVTQIDPDIQTGMFALPVSEDASKARMMGDVDTVFSVYSKSENIEAAKAFLQWLTSEEAVQMWTQECGLISTVKGSPAPATIGDAAEDLLKYFENDKVYRWGFRLWPAGYDMEMASIMQNYYLGDMTKETFIENLDQLWANMIAK